MNQYEFYIIFYFMDKLTYIRSNRIPQIKSKIVILKNRYPMNVRMI